MQWPTEVYCQHHVPHLSWGVSTILPLPWWQEAATETCELWNSVWRGPVCNLWIEWLELLGLSVLARKLSSMRTWQVDFLSSAPLEHVTCLHHTPPHWPSVPSTQLSPCSHLAILGDPMRARDWLEFDHAQSKCPWTISPTHPALFRQCPLREACENWLYSSHIILSSWFWVFFVKSWKAWKDGAGLKPFLLHEISPPSRIPGTTQGPLELY